MPNDYKEEWKTWKLDNLPILPEQYKFKVTHKEQFTKAKERGIKFGRKKHEIDEGNKRGGCAFNTERFRKCYYV